MIIIDVGKVIANGWHANLDGLRRYVAHDAYQVTGRKGQILSTVQHTLRTVIRVP